MEKLQVVNVDMVLGNVEKDLQEQAEQIKNLKPTIVGNQYDFITDEEIDKRVEELKAMTNEEYNAYLDGLIEKSKAVQLELLEIKVKREVEAELKKRNLSMFKDVFNNFIPINDDIDVVKQVDIIENALNEYLKGVQ